MGFEIITAKKKEQQPKINPPDKQPFLPPVILIEIANGKVKIAGVKLPISPLNPYVSVNKKTNISADITP